MPTKGLTETEEATLIMLLNKVKQPWSAEFYNALAPHVALTAIETVFLRKINGELRVLLTKRPANDTHWANMWHSPGTMFRATDVPKQLEVPGNFRMAFDRVEIEIGCRILYAIHVGCIPQLTLRDPELGQVFLCEFADTPKKGDFFPVDQLPSSIIGHHPVLIDAAVKKWHELHP